MLKVGWAQSVALAGWTNVMQSLRHYMSIAALAWAAVFFAVVTDSARAADKRVALVIGNSSYQNVPKLPNPTSDARAVYQRFKDAGFDVGEVQLDVGNLQFKRALRDFEIKANTSDIAVVYFAGHGLEIRGKNYMIPVDARLASERDAPDEAIELERIFETVEGAKNLRLVILDACRDNPFVMTRQLVVSRGLARIEPQRAYTMVAYAAKAGATADDGNGDHSPFTQALLDQLFEPGVGIRIAFGKVVDEVRNNTRGRQVPYLDGSLGADDIALVPAPAKPQAPPPPAVAVQPRPSDELSDFDIARTVNTKEMWVAFIAKYQSGFYATAAKAMLQRSIEAEAQKLQDAKKPDEPKKAEEPKRPDDKVARLEPQPKPPSGPPPALEDDREWDRIKGTSDRRELNDFIKRYPNSPHVLDAQNRLNVLDAIAQETSEWERLKGSDDPAALQDYINKHPKSLYLADAKTRLETVQKFLRDEKARADAKRLAEDQARERQQKEEQQKAEQLQKAAELEWNKLKSSNDPAALQAFIDRYASVPRAGDAQRRLATVQQQIEKAQADAEAKQKADEQKRVEQAALAEQKKAELDKKAEDNAWDKIKKAGNQAALQDFINRYPNSAHLADAQMLLGKIQQLALAGQEWERIRKSADVQALQKFVDTYPDAPNIDEAKKRLNELNKPAAVVAAEAAQKAADQEWNKLKSSNDPKALQAFIDHFSDLPQAADARRRLAAVQQQIEKAQAEAEAQQKADEQKKVEQAALAEQKKVDQEWSKLKGSSDSAALQAFIDHYSDLPQAADARRRLAAVQQQIEKAQADAEAKQKADEQKKVEQAALAEQKKAEQDKKAEDSAWDKIKKSGNQATLQDFVNRYPNSAHLADAQMLLGKVQQLALASQEWDRIKKSADPEAVQKFIDLYPDSPNIDDAKKRLDELNKPASVKVASASPNSELVTAAQKALKGLGCYSGKEDGVLSDATKQGIDRYLAGQGRTEAQGEVTQDFVTELENQHWKKCLPPARIVNAPAEENKKPAKPEERPSQVKRVAGPAAAPAAPRVQPPVQSPAPVKSGGGGGGGGGVMSGVGF
jgi:outer membrane protein assembly factor BamD (BamD/ComL family)